MLFVIATTESERATVFKRAEQSIQTQTVEQTKLEQTKMVDVLRSDKKVDCCS